MTTKNVEILQTAIEYPDRLAEEQRKPEDFILNLDSWDDYDPKEFFKALDLLNPSLAFLAKRIAYLNTSNPSIQKRDEARREIQKFVAVLRDDVSVKHWKIILKPN